MFKISKILTALVDSQKIINQNLAELNKNITEYVKPRYKSTEVRIDACENVISRLETNIYTKEQTVEKINEEYDYRKRYEKCKETNEDLLNLIEKYCRYKDKYEVVDIFKEIDKEYIITKIKE